jgi:hypothetical protein
MGSGIGSGIGFTPHVEIATNHFFEPCFEGP